MTNSTPETFLGLGIAPDILGILEKLAYVKPTPIQHASIPAGINGQDIIGIAQTGTGKTLAFCVPMIQNLLAKGGNGLIVLPTRELAVQVDETFRKIGGPLGMRTAVFIGGASMHVQRNMIKMKPHVLIATPGRLLDHMQQRTITLAQVKVLVLDEADRMLDMGFAPQINRILTAVPKERQTLLFSATMPQDIVQIALKHMKTPLRVEVAPAGTTAERVEQEIFIVHKSEKTKLLLQLLQDNTGSVLVFSRTKHGAKKITTTLQNTGFTAAEIHGNRSQAQRTDALEGFRRGKYRVLVATDIAARGIDVTGIELVINYDLPNDPDDYVHRIGRTARAGRTGKAISFAEPEQRDDLKRIERLTRIAIPRKPLPHGLSMAVMPDAPPRPVHSVSSGSVRKRPTRKNWRVHRR